MFNIFIRVGLLSVVVMLSAIFASAGIPTVKNLEAPLVSPTSAWSSYGSANAHTNGLAAMSFEENGLWVGTTPEIKAMAVSLGAKRKIDGDIDEAKFIKNVYLFVRNNIDTEFRFGLGKGARGALIEQSGTSFDQAELMVSLLREGGVTAVYQKGVIGLTAQQFGHWTGLFRDLQTSNNDVDVYENAQTFNVDKKGACELISNGGIPAVVSGLTNCTGASGVLGASNTEVIMGHVWVVVNGTNYDPSYKLYELNSGLDVGSMMGCGSTNCLSDVGLFTQTNGPINYFGASRYNNFTYNQGNAQEAGFYQTLTDAIHQLEPSMQASDLLGGRSLPVSDEDIPTGLQPIYTGTGGAWSQDVPNQYRSKLTVTAPNKPSVTFYADEIANRSLIWTGQSFGTSGTNPGGHHFYIDGKKLSATLDTGTSYGAFNILVDHPYVANSGTYADENTEFQMVESTYYETGMWNVGTTEPQHQDAVTEKGTGGSFPVTIVHGFGRTGPAAQQVASQLEATWEAMDVTPLWDSCAPVSSTPIFSKTCVIVGHASKAERYKYFRTLMERIAERTTSSYHNPHHDIGIIFSSRAPGRAHISVSSSASYIAPNVTDSASGQRGLDVAAILYSIAEGAAIGDPNHASGRTAAGSVFYGDMLVVDSPTKMASIIANMIPAVDDFEQGRRDRLQAAANAGYTAVFKKIRDGEQYTASGNTSIYRDDFKPGVLLYKNNERSYMVWAALKGAATGTEGTDVQITAPEFAKVATAKKDDAVSVSLAEGSLQFSAPADIVTGSGDFPRSLPFVRTYSGGVWERKTETVSYFMPPGSQAVSNTYDPRWGWAYGGPDEDVFARLGGGWTHNYNVTATLSGSPERRMGSEYAIDSTYIISLAMRLNSVFTGLTDDRRISAFAKVNDNPIMLELMANSISVKVGGGGVKTFFERFVNGVSSYASLDGSNAKVISTGAGRSYCCLYYEANQHTGFSPNYSQQTYTYFNGGGQEIDFEYTQVPMVTGVLTTSGAGYTYQEKSREFAPLFRATEWRFPTGVVLDFEYDYRLYSRNTPSLFIESFAGNGTLWPDGSVERSEAFVLTKVSNNLGRELNFQLSDDFGHTAFRIESVSDENNRTVTFDFEPGCDGLACDTFTVTNANNEVTKYEYIPNSGNLDPANPVRPSYHLRKWFTPDNLVTPFKTIDYDELFRVKKTTDAMGRETIYLPGAVMGDQRWKPTTVVNAGDVETLTVFDENNRVIMTVEPSYQDEN